MKTNCCNLRITLLRDDLIYSFLNDEMNWFTKGEKNKKKKRQRHTRECAWQPRKCKTTETSRRSAKAWQRNEIFAHKSLVTELRTASPSGTARDKEDSALNETREWDDKEVTWETPKEEEEERVAEEEEEEEEVEKDGEAKERLSHWLDIAQRRKQKPSNPTTPPSRKSSLETLLRPPPPPFPPSSPSSTSPWLRPNSYSPVVPNSTSTEMSAAISPQNI